MHIRVHICYVCLDGSVVIGLRRGIYGIKGCGKSLMDSWTWVNFDMEVLADPSASMDTWLTCGRLTWPSNEL